MPLDQREHSGVVVFALSSFRIALRLTSFCDPEHVRLALRKACSHRRAIVSSRPRVFVANAISHLVRLSADIAEVYPLANAASETRMLSGGDEELMPTWYYKLTVAALPSAYGDGPVITWGEMRSGSAPPQYQGLYAFLGNEWKRPVKLAKKYVGRPRGRKSGLRSHHPELFDRSNNSTAGDPNNNVAPVITYDQKYPVLEGTDGRVRRISPRTLRVNFIDLTDHSDAIDEVPSGQ